MATGITHPAIAGTPVARPMVKPLFKKMMPMAAPATTPARAVIPFRSPPARRRRARMGQPRNTSAPTIMKAPRKKRMRGEEPPRERNSRKAREEAKAPSTKPMISGLMYWTTLAWCSPMPPAMSRMKQATHMPMLGGFPHTVIMAARAPKASPAKTIQALGVHSRRTVSASFLAPPCLAAAHALQ